MKLNYTVISRLGQRGKQDLRFVDQGKALGFNSKCEVKVLAWERQSDLLFRKITPAALWRMNY